MTLKQSLINLFKNYPDYETQPTFMFSKKDMKKLGLKKGLSFGCLILCKEDYPLIEEK